MATRAIVNNRVCNRELYLGLAPKLQRKPTVIHKYIVIHVKYHMLSKFFKKTFLSISSSLKLLIPAHRNSHWNNVLNEKKIDKLFRGSSVRDMTDFQ